MRQRSREWFEIRRGKLTASRFGDVLAKPTTKRYRGYMQEIIEELLGVPNFEDNKPWFQHGIEWEDHARGVYAWDTQTDLKDVGFVVHPEYDFIGCSPDNLIGEDGCLEIKCHKSLQAFLKSKDKLEARHKPQVQGQLWITQREWCHFVNFYKNEETSQVLSSVYQVESEPDYHKLLEKACIDFYNIIKGVI